MARTIAWRIWYFLVTPIRAALTGLEHSLFWRHYTKIKRGKVKAEGRLLPIAARELIASAELIEVLSLGGIDEGELAEFANCRVLGRTTVKDQNTLKVLAERLLIANEASSQGLLCIDGEYGLRVTSQGKTVDLMICFACGNVWATGPADCTGMGNICWTPIGRLLNKILQRDGIPLPEAGLAHHK